MANQVTNTPSNCYSNLGSKFDKHKLRTRKNDRIDKSKSIRNLG